MWHGPEPAVMIVEPQHSAKASPAEGITHTGDCKHRVWPITVETACAGSPEHALIGTKET